MDDITWQFLLLAKRLRQELIKSTHELVNAIRDNTNAKGEHEKVQPQRPILQAELQIPEAIKTESKSDSERNYRLQRLLTVGTWLTFLAAAVYAAITAGQWSTARKALIDSNASTERQFRQIEQEITALKTANSISVANNRPWVGLAPFEHGGRDFIFQQGHDQKGEFAETRFTWNFKNSGSRPARIEKFRDTADWSTLICSERPNYNVRPPINALVFQSPHVHAVVLPGTYFGSAFQIGIPKDQWELIKADKVTYCAYALIEYRDVGDDAVLHHTSECQQVVFVPNAEPRVEQCDNTYAKAD